MAQDGPLASHGGTASHSPGEAGAPVVAFDFDGTLTVRDSFTAFLEWRAGQLRYALGLAKLVPAALYYVLEKDRGRIKAAAIREFLHGMPRAELAAEAAAFAQARADQLFRPDALAVWRRWRDQAARLVIVTASPVAVVAPFAERLGADELIGTELAYDAEQRVTGAFATPNCRGQQKVDRLRARFGADLRLAAAYGDTAGDREMLAMAETRGYRVFKGRP